MSKKFGVLRFIGTVYKIIGVILAVIAVQAAVIVILAVSGVFGMLMAGRIAAPMLELRRLMAAAGGGDLTVHGDVVTEGDVVAAVGPSVLDPDVVLLGSEPDQFAAQAYDTLFIVADAIKAAGAADPEKIKDALGKVKRSGVLGAFSFTPGRDPADTTGVVVIELKGGKFGLLP